MLLMKTIRESPIESSSPFTNFWMSCMLSVSPFKAHAWIRRVTATLEGICSRSKAVFSVVTASTIEEQVTELFLYEPYWLNVFWKLAFKYEHQMTIHKKLWIIYSILQKILILYEKPKKKNKDLFDCKISETREISSLSHRENADVTDRMWIPFRDNI